MELKPNYGANAREANARLNRTFMELKLNDRELKKLDETVLIVPLWN